MTPNKITTWPSVVDFHFAISSQTGVFISARLDLKAAPVALIDWFPATPPTAGDSFLGLDRSANLTDLDCMRRRGPVDKALQIIVVEACDLHRQGVCVDYCYASSDMAAYLPQSIHASYGEVKVRTNLALPPMTVLLLQEDTWSLVDRNGSYLCHAPPKNMRITLGTPTAVVNKTSRCTCGTAAVGGLHSSWCDLPN